MRKLIRRVFVTVLPLGLALLLFASGFADYGRVMEALSGHWGEASLICLTQILATFAVAFRYWLALRFCCIKFGLWRIFGVTSVATGVSLCLPFSPVVQDGGRVWLLCGGCTGSVEKSLGMVSRATVIDRLAGLGGMFFVGFCASVFDWLSGTRSIPFWVVTILFLLTLSVICFRWVIALFLDRLENFACAGFFARGVALAVRVFEVGRGGVFVPLSLYLISAALFLLLSFGNWLGFRAIGTPITYSLVTMVFPLIVLSGFLPINYGGFGGAQFVAMLLLVPFGYKVGDVASGFALVAVITLVTQCALGAVASLYFVSRRICHGRGSRKCV